MLRHFFPEVSDELCEEFSTYIPNNSVSMAELQGMFLLHKDNLDSLIQAVKDLKLGEI